MLVSADRRAVFYGLAHVCGLALLPLLMAGQVIGEAVGRSPLKSLLKKMVQAIVAAH
jgi:hypothetical protein